MTTPFTVGALSLLISSSIGWCSTDPPRVRIEPLTPVPANHLKFYLHFSEPMERGEVFRFLKLIELDESGQEIGEVKEPFREIELWGEDAERLTLWFHPGRQKPGVNLYEELGPVLKSGSTYRLEISADWKSASGVPLGKTHTHPIFVHDSDNKCPSPATWEIGKVAPLYYHGAQFESNPNASPGIPYGLKIDTGEVLDPVSVRKHVKLRRNGKAFPSYARPWLHAIASDQSNVMTTKMDAILILRPPDEESKGPWPPGDYELVIDPQLEDLAGNSIARPFNLDLEKNPDFEERTEPVILPFTIPEPDSAP